MCGSEVNDLKGLLKCINRSQRNFNLKGGLRKKQTECRVWGEKRLLQTAAGERQYSETPYLAGIRGVEGKLAAGNQKPPVDRSACRVAHAAIRAPLDKNHMKLIIGCQLGAHLLKGARAAILLRQQAQEGLRRVGGGSALKVKHVDVGGTAAELLEPPCAVGVHWLPLSAGAASRHDSVAIS
jgi:hypothetical protein